VKHDEWDGYDLITVAAAAVVELVLLAAVFVVVAHDGNRVVVEFVGEGVREVLERGDAGVAQPDRLLADIADIRDGCEFYLLKKHVIRT
jgi:hypothetical protein